MLHASIAVLTCVSSGRAQTDPTAPTNPAARTPASETPAAANPGSVDQRLLELTQRIAAQEQENARQQAEIEAYKAGLSPSQSKDAATAAAISDDAQLSQLLGSSEVPQAFEPAFRLYGFADTGLQRIWGGFFNNGLALTDATNFVLGNVNVYLDATPLKDLRMLTEVRFTTLPNGAETANLATGNMERQDTAVFDPSSSAGGVFAVHWGSIVLERAQIEWMPMDTIGVRVGYFLTPYGIWNVDHGSPTRIMLRPPLFISVNLFPERQTGLELYGVFHALPWDLGYSVYVSNGRTYGNVDFSDDKALGGRIQAMTRRPFPIQLGASIYRGTSQNWEKARGVDAMGRPALLRTEKVALNELAAGVDVSLDLDALRIRAEFLMRRLVYDQGKRDFTLGAPNANATHSAGYVLLAYRLPWLGLEPLIVGEFLRWPTIEFGEVVLTGSGGLNVYFNSALTLRFQYSYTQVVDFEETTRNHSNNYLHIVASRLIISY